MNEYKNVKLDPWWEMTRGVVIQSTTENPNFLKQKID